MKAKEIGSFIEQLQQENQQLRERINMTININRKNKELLSILDEIREYLNEFIIYVDEDGEVYFKEEFRTEYNDLLEILDKVKNL